MKSLNVRITGITPLLMHKFSMDMLSERPKGQLPGEIAEQFTYRSTSGELCVPQANFLRSLITAAKYTKDKGKSSLQTKVAACVWAEAAEFLLGTKDYTIDTRSAVNSTTKGRIITHRPRLDKWGFSAVLNYDEMLISRVNLEKVVTDAGVLVGIMGFRPEKKGPFGRFTAEFV